MSSFYNVQGFVTYNGQVFKQIFNFIFISLESEMELYVSFIFTCIY